ncbi:MAG TPA: type II/IV secretion system protein [Planctomycetes bacterium]|nr:type II/IV secretion system protein [Planctomycetota bacterium]
MSLSIADLAVKYGILDKANAEPYFQLVSSDALQKIAIDTERRSQFRNNSPSRELQLLRAIAKECALEVIDLENREVSNDLLELLSFQILFRHHIIPIERNDDTLVIATSAPFDDEILSSIASETGLGVDLVLAESEQIRTFLKERVGVAGATVGDMLVSDAPESAEEAIDGADAERLARQSSVVKLVNELLIDAVESGASDIHIEPADRSFGIRYRIDGMLIDQTVPTDICRFHSAIVSRLKIMAKLNVAEKRLPQDGRIKIKVHNKEIDVRVSTIPMVHGESIVLRLLQQGGQAWGFSQLNMSAELEESFRTVAQSPHGIFLVTGPTGSGKTTTLYNTLFELRNSRPETKIVTIEDPVEYSLPGVHQIQINEATGLTFARGLRSILRHDPDVVLVGEIRDPETAKSAIEAALTGHLVLSTLHTNDSSSAFTRLCEMGVEPYLVASTVRAVTAQRLVRRLCDHCKQLQSECQVAIPDELADTGNLYMARGCRDCGESGYKGRTALFEFLVTDSQIRDLCTQRAPAFQILEHARKNGLQTLRDAGWECVRKGITTLAEVVRVTGV